MKIQQIYTGCLSQGAYYIESNGEVAIIDPLREVQSYLDMAKNQKAKIKYIFETHFHADFVSGHVTLGKETGAPIIYGPNANPAFDCVIAKDNEVFQLGAVAIKVIHTPGHTMESASFLLLDEHGNEHAVFTGDTLFLGDVGRPDLAQKSAVTQDDLAGILFDSLRDKLMVLPDEVIVYPGHGAGSACGKNMSKETVGSIGDQKENNYALRADMTKTEFIKEVTEGLLPPPAYFPLNVQLNKNGYENVGSLFKRAKAMSAMEFENAANETSAVILDVRDQNEFAESHIPRSTFIGINGGFAPWVGALIKDVQQPILLVLPEGELESVITRLSRVGFDNVLGYLKGGIADWKLQGKELDSVKSITPETFSKLYEQKSLNVFDVRKPSEFLSERVTDAVNTPLDEINEHLSEYGGNASTESYVHCAGGYRSMIAISILKSRGIHNLVNVEQGFSGIKNTKISTTDYVCPSTL